MIIGLFLILIGYILVFTGMSYDNSITFYDASPAKTSGIFYAIAVPVLVAGAVLFFSAFRQGIWLF